MALGIKSSNNQSKSLITIINENEKIDGLILWNDNLVIKERILKIPWYLIFMF